MRTRTFAPLSAILALWSPPEVPHTLSVGPAAVAVVGTILHCTVQAQAITQSSSARPFTVPARVTTPS
jgi:hypothetical protein